MYDINEWLELHLESLTKRPLNQLSITTPLLIKGDLSRLRSVAAVVEETRTSLSPLFDYDVKPIEIFCFTVD